ncbi:MAG TPA: alpha/beta fold hydrolase [Blastocatellia bacterium]|nr:alpha/beta fold hydrolase [Blastocatellia bacterium]
MSLVETRFITARDRARVAYDMCGAGPGLILLHGGFVHDRQSWRTSGYVEKLQAAFTVIAIDIRGHGESDKPEDAESYAADRLIADVEQVGNACGLSRFAVWGFSFGASLALQLAARSQRVTRAIAAGSYFGPLFSDEQLKMMIGQMETIARAQAEGRLDELPAQQQSFANQTHLPAAIAAMKGLAAWPTVWPEDLLCPTLVYCGSKNTQARQALEKLTNRIVGARAEIKILPEFDHMQEFTEIDTVLPVVREFLSKA